MKRILFFLLLSAFSCTLASRAGGLSKKCPTCRRSIAKCDKSGYSVSKPTTGFINGYEWVDLGLSVKWATCNVGASNPSDYGDYFAWGEVRSKLHYDWNNCFDSLDSEGDSWGTYKIGGRTWIAPTSGHDAARENWGGTWRIPTDAENDELGKKCEWTWMSIDGHVGYKITGPNGNSIFLPAAGWYSGSASIYVGEYGFYWSSTLSPSDSDRARSLDFSSGNHCTSNDSRSCGLCVRPVTE